MLNSKQLKLKTNTLYAVLFIIVHTIYSVNEYWKLSKVFLLIANMCKNAQDSYGFSHFCAKNNICQLIIGQAFPLFFHELFPDFRSHFL